MQSRSESRRGLSVPIRLRLLEGDADVAEARILALDERVDMHDRRLDVLATKIAVGAALGALVGGGLVSLLIAVLT